MDQVVASEQELPVSPGLPTTTSTDVAATDVPADCSTPAKSTNPPVIANCMHWTSSNQLGPSAPISELPNDTTDQPPAPANSISRPLQLNDVICSSNCPSESISLRHNMSDLSLESRLHGGGVSLVHTRRVPLEGIELLDDEIKADIRTRIRRELARPQYKKDLFFTGSLLQLGCGQANLDTSTSVSPALLPHSVPEKHCSFVASPTGPLMSVNTAVAQRVLGARTSVQLACQPSDSSVQELHNSQTNLSLATSVGAGGTSFIPPAPCPTVQPQTPIPAAPMTTATTLLDSLDSYNPQPKAANLIGPVPNGSPDMLSTNLCPFIRQDNQPATPDHDLQSVGPVHAGEEGDVDLEGRGDQDDLLDVEDDVDLDAEDVDGNGVGDDVDVDVEDDDEDEDEEFDTAQSSRTCCYRCPFVCNLPDMSCFSITADMLAPMRSFIHELLSPWILASPTFTFMLLSSTATMLGLVIPYLMLPDLLVELNWPLGDSGFALSALAVGNTVGRLIASKLFRSYSDSRFGPL
ncbi:hypothetical protein P879_04262 [Paragonimus westermani]|uniref:Uncharacterized protein n=1 Tax=Paragonimus westermani TaxID=34504 RepID=A0A8T0DQJ1_9TREM|nr:hypothetical protein P879_04262 [Paragonimus westermani]